MKVAEKEGKKKKQKTRSSRKKEESYVEWIGWGEIKKKETKKRERIKEKKYPYVKNVFLVMLGSLS